jgi:hypothetical protein
MMALSIPRVYPLPTQSIAREHKSERAAFGEGHSQLAGGVAVVVGVALLVAAAWGGRELVGGRGSGGA